MGNFDINNAVPGANPVKLFERFQKAAQMFNNMMRYNLLELIVFERPRRHMKIMDHIRVMLRVDIYSDRVGTGLAGAPEDQTFTFFHNVLSCPLEDINLKQVSLCKISLGAYPRAKTTDETISY
jgi:hypothetical protein